MTGYGYSPENPIRVSGFYAEKRYMENLCADKQDVPIRFVRLGSGRSAATGHPLDVYEGRIKRGPFGKRIVLYVDIYGDTDWRAPEGFRLCSPAPGTDEDDSARAEALFTAIRELQGILGDR